MKQLIRLVITYLFLSLSGTLCITGTATAALTVFACEPEWASLVSEIGGERVSIYTATTAFQDPHHIQARPSLIAKLRRADLLICSGADLEAGWLPVLQRQAANRAILPGQAGFIEAASLVKPLDIPTDMDRSQGDIHASGNPHVHLDPRRLLDIAEVVLSRLIEIDAAGANFYQQRFAVFKSRWLASITRWQQQASLLKGKRIVVHHRDWVYLFDWLGIEIAGALEPKPGLPTTAGHLQSLKQALSTEPAVMIVYTSYQNPRAALRFAEMVNIPALQLPYTIGGDEQVNDLFGLFDVTIQKLNDTLQ